MPDERDKGLGYFGPLKRPDGMVSTELSIGVSEDWTEGKETEIPLLVPTLTRDEIKHLLDGRKATPLIEDKAREHARTRIQSGLDPFAQEGEQLSPELREWNVAHDKEKEENAARAVKGLDLPQEAIDAYKLWWTDTEANFEFQRLPMSAKNRHRRQYAEDITRLLSLKPEESKQLERFYKPSFLKSFAWSALEALPPIIAPGGPKAAVQRLWKGEAPVVGLHRPAKEAILPPSPAGELIGSFAGELPAIMGAFGVAGKAAKMGVPLLKAAGVTGRVTRGAVGFGLADVPYVFGKERRPEEILKSAALGMAGFGPAKWYMKGLGAGTAATMMSRPEEARFTGSRALDVGVPAAVLFGGMGALEKVKLGRRRAKGPSPAQQLESKLKDYVELEPTERDAFFKGFMEASPGQDELRMSKEILRRVGNLEKSLKPKLQAAGHEKLANQMSSVSTDVRAAVQSGNEELLARNINHFNELSLEVEVALGAEKSAFMLGGNAEIGLSEEGLLRYAGKKKTGPISRHVINEIQKKPIVIDRAIYEELSDVKAPGALWSPRDEYLAKQALGSGRTLVEGDVRRVGFTPETLPELFAELADANVLGAPRLPTVVPGAPSIALGRKLTEIENSGLPLAEKQRLIGQVNSVMATHEAKVKRLVTQAEAKKRPPSSAKQFNLEEKKYMHWRGRILSYKTRIEQGGAARAAAKKEALAEGMPEEFWKHFEYEFGKGKTVAEREATALREKTAVAEKRDFDWMELDRMTVQRVTEIGATFTPDPADPLFVAALFERKGLAGAWNSVTGEFRVQQGNTFKSMSVKAIQALPEAGDMTLKGELVITSKADPNFHVVKKGGEFILAKKGSSGRGKKRRPYTYDEVRDVLYSNKGILVEYKTPEGNLVLRNLESGETAVASEAEALALVKTPGNPPNLTPGADVPPDPVSFDSGAAKAMPPTDVTPRKVVAPLRLITPKKYMFSKYQEALDVPTYNWWVETEAVARTERAWLHKMGPQLRNLRKTLKGRNEDALLHYVETPTFGERARLARSYGFVSEDFAATKVVQDIFEKTFGPEWREFVTGHIRDAKATGEIADALRPWIKDGGFNHTTEGLHDMLTNAVYSKARLMMAPQMEALTALKKTIRASNLTGHTKQKVLTDLREYMSGVSGTALADKAVASDFIAEVNKRLGTDITGSVADQVISTYMLHSYSASMPFRMHLVLRNLTQPVTTGIPYVGPKYWAKGVRRAYTEKGIKFTKSVIGEEFTGVPMEHALPQEAAVRKMYNVGMFPYRGADWWNRNTMANIARVAGESELPKFLQNKITLQEFMNKTGIVYLDGAVQQEILAPLAGGNQEAFLKLFARNLIEDTQWIYRAGNASQLLRFKVGGARVGRLLGQFGVWPTNYIQWVGRGLSTGNLAATEQFIARWMLSHAAVAGAGAAIGVPIAKSLFLAPMRFTGGPAVDMLTDVLDMVGGGYRGEAAKRRLGTYGWKLLVPGSYFYTDMKDAYEMYKDGEPWNRVALRAIGWRLEE